MTPPIKWAGGKRWLIPYLNRYYNGQRIVEPFCGACSVSLGLRPTKAVLNDANSALISFWKTLQLGLPLTFAVPPVSTEKEYYNVRKIFSAFILSGEAGDRIVTDWDVAGLFYYLNKTCFNGLYRVNAKGEFNVPWGKRKNPSFEYDVAAFKYALKGWSFSNKDFESLKTKINDFVYIDPPYDIGFDAFTAKGFKWEDQVRLAKWASKQKGTVVVSNAATPRIVRLYRALDFKVRIIEAPRRISCDGNREKAKEILAVR